MILQIRKVRISNSINWNLKTFLKKDKLNKVRESKFSMNGDQKAEIAVRHFPLYDISKKRQCVVRWRIAHCS